LLSWKISSILLIHLIHSHYGITLVSTSKQYIGIVRNKFFSWHRDKNDILFTFICKCIFITFIYNWKKFVSKLFFNVFLMHSIVFLLVVGTQKFSPYCNNPITSFIGILSLYLLLMFINQLFLGFNRSNFCYWNLSVSILLHVWTLFEVLGLNIYYHA